MKSTLDEHIEALFAPFLLQHTGQDIARVGGARYAIENVQRVYGLASPEDLLERAQHDDEVRGTLINALTVPETWFFRDLAPFSQLAEDLHARRIHHPADDHIDLLCWPCATGEEAYSLAAVAHACGYDAAECHIEAHDINQEHIDTARVGRYQLRAFRTIIGNRWDQGFVHEGDEVVIAPVLRAMITFSQGNVRDASVTSSGRRYDVIFCRNLLIYLTEAAQREVIDQLVSLLHPGGTLYVGHAEAGLVKNAYLQAVPRVGVFAFRRRNSTGGVAAETRPALKAVSAAKRSVRHKANTPRVKKEANSASVTLAELRAMADAGRLEEAQKQCATLLSVTDNDTEVAYVCALVAQAQGRAADAKSLLEGIVSREPHHADALLMLAAQYEAQGDRDGAARLRARAMGGKDAPPEAQ